MPHHERGTAARLMVAPLLAGAVVVLASACGAIKPTAGVSGPSQPTAHASASPAAKRSSASPAAQAGVGVMGRFKTGLRQLTFTEPAHTGPTGEQLGPRS